MPLSHTQKEDLNWIREDQLSDLIVNKYLDLKNITSIEIVSSYENEGFVLMLKAKLFIYGIKNVYVTYRNGPIFDEIEKYKEGYLDNRIEFYKKRIEEKFVRITLVSPFSLPIPLTKYVSYYRQNLDKLSFLSDYLVDSERLMIVKPNQSFARYLGISLDSLWDKVLRMQENNLDSKLDIINSLHLKEIHFKSDEGTNCSISLNPEHPFIGNVLELHGYKFHPNVPSKEIYTSPNKYGSNGKIVFTKPLFYQNECIYNIEITLHDGYIIENKNLDFLLSKDESLRYLGEVALCDFSDDYFCCPLLDENTGSHIAIGKAYPYYIKDTSKINHSFTHIDLIFGSNSLSADGITIDDKIIPIMRMGKVIL